MSRRKFACVLRAAFSVRRNHEGNKRIVDDADMVVTLVSPDRKGGTENAIKHAEKAGKPVTLL